MDYSQNGEQKIIIEYFKGFTGILLDIGANDGETLSNSRALMELGWSGVLVEPSESAFKKLNVLYPDNKIAELIPFGISDNPGLFKFFDSGTHLNKGDTSLLSTCKESELKRWEGSNNHFTETEIECITIEELKYLTGIEHYHFITIDAEGMDLIILKQIDLSNTRMICIEVNDIQENIKEVTDYCSSFGLTKKLFSNFENIIFAQ